MYVCIYIYMCVCVVGISLQLQCSMLVLNKVGNDDNKAVDKSDKVNAAHVLTGLLRAVVHALAQSTIVA